MPPDTDIGPDIRLDAEEILDLDEAPFERQAMMTSARQLFGFGS